jgi:hypothetical protein
MYAMSHNVRHVISILLASLVAGIGTASFSFSASDRPATQAKASALLLQQISLRREQLADPRPERLSRMQAKGMDTAAPGTQRILLYLYDELTSSQTEELEALGIRVYPNSWIPAVGVHPAGFILADMPVDKLEALAVKDYVVRLDTAERQSTPQANNPQGGLR